MTSAAALLVVWSFAAQDSIEDDSYEYAEETAVKQALEATLSQPEFERLKARSENEAEDAPEWLQKFFRWLLTLFEGEATTEERAGSTLPPFVRLPILAGVLFVVVFLLVKALSSARRRGRAPDEDSPGGTVLPSAAPSEIEPEEYWQRALEHGERRHFREGIRELLLGAMSATERRGAIRYRRGLTNRDYLHATRGPARLSFSSIASTFERVYFGRREATSEAFRDCCREYQKSFLGATS
jgi:hypothetical protein